MSKVIDPMVESLVNSLVKSNDNKEDQNVSIDDVSTDRECKDSLESNILKCMFESDTIGSTNIPTKEGKKFNPTTGRIE